MSNINHLAMSHPYAFTSQDEVLVWDPPTSSWIVTRTGNPYITIGSQQIPLPFIYQVPGNVCENPGEIVEESSKITEGCTCNKCGEFFPYAQHIEPEKFRCYACKVTW